MTKEELYLRVGEETVRFSSRKGACEGRYACLSGEKNRFSLTVWDGAEEAEPSPEELCGAGARLWQVGHRENPVPLFCGDHPRLLLCSTLQNRVVGVTAEAGRADFMPRSIPLRFETPLMNDLVTIPHETFRLTALRFGVPYGVIFPEKAGDCRLFARAEEISRLHIFPQGAEVVFAYVQKDTVLHLRPYHRDGTTTLRGRDICAALAAAVAVGKCIPDRAVRIPLSEGEGRAVCTKDWNLFLTLPIFGEFA
ncbi:MAG: hypothetical protein J6C26_05250 [Clostridia bacterium]|nr:hypothetical protein [Clostridia bacterium]